MDLLYSMNLCESYCCYYMNCTTDPNAVVTLNILYCQQEDGNKMVEDTAVSSTIIQYVLDLNTEISVTR